MDQMNNFDWLPDVYAVTFADQRNADGSYKKFVKAEDYHLALAVIAKHIANKFMKLPAQIDSK